MDTHLAKSVDSSPIPQDFDFAINNKGASNHGPLKRALLTPFCEQKTQKPIRNPVALASQGTRIELKDKLTYAALRANLQESTLKALDNILPNTVKARSREEASLKEAWEHQLQSMQSKCGQASPAFVRLQQLIEQVGLIGQPNHEMQFSTYLAKASDNADDAVVKALAQAMLQRYMPSYRPRTVTERNLISKKLAETFANVDREDREKYGFAENAEETVWTPARVQTTTEQPQLSRVGSHRNRTRESAVGVPAGASIQEGPVEDSVSISQQLEPSPTTAPLQSIQETTTSSPNESNFLLPIPDPELRNPGTAAINNSQTSPAVNMTSIKKTWERALLRTRNKLQKNLDALQQKNPKTFQGQAVMETANRLAKVSGLIEHAKSFNEDDPRSMIKAVYQAVAELKDMGVRVA